MHEEGSVLVNGDTLGAHGGDRGSRGVVAYEMDVNVAVQLEERGNCDTLVRITAEAVDKNIDLRVLVFVKNPVHIVGIEIPVADITLQEEVVVFRHSSVMNYATKLAAFAGPLKDYKTHGSTDFGATCVIL